MADGVDDCGNAFNTGSVTVSFTGGDPPLNLISTVIGIWGGRDAWQSDSGDDLGGRQEQLQFDLYGD